MLRYYPALPMGNFWGSIHVRTENRERVREVLEELAKKGNRFLLAPLNNGWVTIYPSENGQDWSLSQEIASHEDWYLIHLVNHDDSFFAYKIFRQRRLLDEYISVPGYFSRTDLEREQPLVGHPERFSDLLVRPVPYVRAILKRADEEDSMRAADQMEEFAATLGIKKATNAYEYFELGEQRSSGRKLLHIPDKAPDRKKTADRKRAEKEHLDQLRRKHWLLAWHQAHKDRLLWFEKDPDSSGFLLQESRRDWKPTPVLRLSPPWKKVLKVLDEPLANAHDICLSQSGHYAVIRTPQSEGIFQLRTQLWDLRQQGLVRDFQAAGQCQFSADDQRIFSLMPQEIAILSVPELEVIAKIPTETAIGLAVHPSEPALIINEQMKLRLVNLQDLSTRELYLGGKSAFAAAFHQRFRQQLASIDLTEYRRVSERNIEKNIASFERAHKKSKDKRILDEGAIQQMRDQMRLMMEEQIERFQKLKTEKPKIPQQAVNGAAVMRFSKDGKMLFCGGHGVKIYWWEEVKNGPEDVRQSAFAFSAKMKRADGYEFPASISAMAEDVEGQRLFFGGMDGVLYSIDLNSGEVTIIYAMPQREQIYQCEISGDATAIACRCQQIWTAANQHPAPPIIYIWNLSASMMQMATPAIN